MRNPIIWPLLAVALASGCAGTQAEPAAPERLTVQVLGTLPHDTSAFTEGLEFSGTTLYESRGLAGQSALTAGPAGQSPATRVALPAPLFGEGVTVLGTKLWQLTWQDGFAIERDSKTLADLRRVPFEGEGWGLCHQPDGRLVMSNGTAKLTFRDPQTFAVTGSVDVGVDQLNELECVGDTVYANVWQTGKILRIDANTGHVTGSIDASGLRTPLHPGEDVLNGIAAIPGTDEFLVTGKLWPATFRVRFVPETPRNRSGAGGTPSG
ncbi:glutaminyl-peptide cyclotransferase [Amycolatopsis sp. PS_44_ISF1]|uniref:glutaminyl-peptide cyclotransferase n=1 Tax=Amycolatopsis sp. PS_44_ISF1 TaxID=2974917 RepID=UPI0028DEE745|nr:glutaminyl-peptide cyclotransferase [Amycolatopsis sp. PS_44_ISF1]MDT8911160.1 glutaminyl-peptide cyclotransferase [Amycolatopsis sp. PS_44_ISF1]MDT8916365.1 glutaminyl-peptide cyclotransferase [Amycolatopsis sp. PS_44_ISF1]